MTQKHIQNASELTDRQRSIWADLTHCNDGARIVDGGKALLISIPKTREYLARIREKWVRRLDRHGLGGTYLINQEAPQFSQDDLEDFVRMGLLTRQGNGLYKTTDLGREIYWQIGQGE